MLEAGLVPEAQATGKAVVEEQLWPSGHAVQDSAPASAYEPLEQPDWPEVPPEQY